MVIPLQIRVNLGVIAIKAHCTFPRAPRLQFNDQIVKYHMPYTRWWGLPLWRDTVGVFDSHSRLKHEWIELIWKLWSTSKRIIVSHLIVSSVFVGWINFVIFSCGHRTSNGGSAPQNSRGTTTNHPSRKLSKLDKPDMQDTAGEIGTNL